MAPSPIVNPFTSDLQLIDTIGGQTYTNSNPVPVTIGGIESGEIFSNVSQNDMWTKLLYPTVLPTVVLSWLNTDIYGFTREYGRDIVGVNLQGLTDANTNPISAVVFKKNNVGFYTVPVPLPAGGAELANDASTISTSTNYTCSVTAGLDTVTSNQISFTFVYPYYIGAGAPGLSAAQVGALTKTIKTESNTVVTSSLANQVWYFAYPKSYGLLSSIKDQNGFPYDLNQSSPTKDWIIRDEQITGLDTTAQDYYIYEFTTQQTVSNYTNTFYI